MNGGQCGLFGDSDSTVSNTCDDFSGRIATVLEKARPMRHITHIIIDHVVVSSERSYEAVKASLEARMGLLGNTDEFVRQVAAHALWEQVVARVIEKRLGLSGFSKSSRDNCSHWRENAGR